MTKSRLLKPRIMSSYAVLMDVINRVLDRVATKNGLAPSTNASAAIARKGLVGTASLSMGWMIGIVLYVC